MNTFEIKTVAEKIEAALQTESNISISELIMKLTIRKEIVLIINNSTIKISLLFVQPVYSSPYTLLIYSFAAVVVQYKKDKSESRCKVQLYLYI